MIFIVLFATRFEPKLLYVKADPLPHGGMQSTVRYSCGNQTSLEDGKGGSARVMVDQ